MKTGAKLKLAAPIRGSHGNSAAMAFDVELKMPEGEAVIRVIDVMTFNDAGQFTRSEEHTSELQSLMRISYAVSCLQKNNKQHTPHLTISHYTDIMNNNKQP